MCAVDFHLMTLHGNRFFFLDLFLFEKAISLFVLSILDFFSFVLFLSSLLLYLLFSFLKSQRMNFFCYSFYVRLRARYPVQLMVFFSLSQEGRKFYAESCLQLGAVENQKNVLFFLIKIRYLHHNEKYSINMTPCRDN